MEKEKSVCDDGTEKSKEAKQGQWQTSSRSVGRRKTRKKPRRIWKDEKGGFLRGEQGKKGPKGWKHKRAKRNKEAMEDEEEKGARGRRGKRRKRNKRREDVQF